MTTDTPPVEAAVAAALVEPPAESRLAQLHSAYEGAKAQADAAAAALKAITDAIKLELSQAAPEVARVDLRTPGAPPLRLTYSESWRVDARKLKADDPETYVRYAKKSGSWTLRAVGGPDGGDD